MENEKLIMFSWTNMYMSGIHAGIQAGHSWMDMAVKYKNKDSDSACIFWDWAMNHKTVNIRSGGFQSSLIDIVKVFQRADNPYPWMEWREEEAALNGAMTAVSIVLPEHVYAYIPYVLAEELKIKNPLTPVEEIIYDLIKSTRLAG